MDQNGVGIGSIKSTAHKLRKLDLSGVDWIKMECVWSNWSELDQNGVDRIKLERTRLK